MTEEEKKELMSAVAELRRLREEFAAEAAGIELRQREALTRVATAFEQAKIEKLKKGLARL